MLPTCISGLHEFISAATLKCNTTVREHDSPPVENHRHGTRFSFVLSIDVDRPIYRHFLVILTLFNNAIGVSGIVTPPMNNNVPFESWFH